MLMGINSWIFPFNGLFFPVQIHLSEPHYHPVMQVFSFKMLHQRNRWKPFGGIIHLVFDSNWQGSRIPNTPNLIGPGPRSILATSHDSHVTSCHIIGREFFSRSRPWPFRNHLTGILSLAMGWLELDNGNLRTGPHSNAESPHRSVKHPKEADDTSLSDGKKRPEQLLPQNAVQQLTQIQTSHNNEWAKNTNIYRAVKNHQKTFKIYIAALQPSIFGKVTSPHLKWQALLFLYWNQFAFSNNAKYRIFFLLSKSLVMEVVSMHPSYSWAPHRIYPLWVAVFRHPQ